MQFVLTSSLRLTLFQVLLIFTQKCGLRSGNSKQWTVNKASKPGLASAGRKIIRFGQTVMGIRRSSEASVIVPTGDKSTCFYMCWSPPRHPPLACSWAHHFHFFRESAGLVLPYWAVSPASLNTWSILLASNQLIPFWWVLFWIKPSNKLSICFPNAQF